MSTINDKMRNHRNIRNMSVIAHVDHGKCFAKNTRILMYSGDVKKVEDIQVGDKLMGDDSSPRSVKSLARGRDKMYTIKSNDGQIEYTVNKDHILSLVVTGGTSKYRFYESRNRWQVEWWTKPEFKGHSQSFKDEKDAIHLYQDVLSRKDTVRNGDILDIEVEKFLEKSDFFRSYFYGYNVGCDAWDEKTVKIDPYELGIWLGDGTSAGPSITSIDKEVLDYFKQNHKLTKTSNSKKDCITYYIKEKDGSTNIFRKSLKEYGLINNKHIPKDYKINSRSNRLKLLAGIIDSDGHKTKDNRYEITFKNENLADDVIFLCRSLGFKTSKYETMKKSQTMTEKKLYFRFFVSGKELTEIPVLLKRKKCENNDSAYALNRYSISIIEKPEDDYYGFVIDRNRRFLLDNFTVVHNTTLTDSLLNKAGVISDKDTGTKRGTDVHKQEEERGITINSTGISLQYTLQDDQLPEDSNGNDFLINLIDSPGHVDFNCEVTAALRVTDGALVVVDAVEGACVQTETVLRQALVERIKPVLMINKVDRFLFEKEYEPEECYRQFHKVIGEINNIVDTYQNEKIMGDLKFNPEIGTVAFGSGYYAWGFTLDNVAAFWSKQTGEPKEKFLKRMWSHEKTFVKYVIGPIVTLKKHADNKDHSKIFAFANKIGIKLSAADKELTGKKLVNCILKKWYPASDALLEMIVGKLPSPDKAQTYRAETLYSGPKDDAVMDAIKRCDPDGPLMVYISKMVPNKDFSKFYAFGRVFSGTIKGGKKVIFYGAQYEHSNGKDTFKGISPSNVYAMMANKMQTMDECPAGNTVCLAGMDQYILKNGTISDVENVHPFHAMKFTVSPVVRVAVNVKNPAQLPKFIKALERLSKSDPLCQISYSESGETVIAGAGELHIDVILNNLRTDYCKEVAFNVSDPVVPFRETVQSTSVACLSKSPNNHNRLWIKAEPLREDLVRDIENGQFDWKIDNKTASRELIEKYGWNPNDANPKRVWMFGPEGVGTNVIIDGTSGVQYMNEIKDSVVTAFKWVCNEGVLCDEPLRGIKFTITDCTLHADNIHRGGGQIVPATRKAMLASMLMAEPCLSEPIFEVNITAPDNCMGGIYNVISQRRGQIEEQTNVDGTPMYKLKGTLPVMESFGFDAALRGETSGQAFQQCSFSKWDKMTGSIDNPESRLMKTVTDVRIRKGMPEEIPPVDNFRDKL